MPTVIVHWSPWRTEQQKQRVARKMAQALAEEGGARPEDILIIFQNIQDGDSARGPDLLKPSNPSLPTSDNDTDGSHGA